MKHISKNIKKATRTISDEDIEEIMKSILNSLSDDEACLDFLIFLKNLAKDVKLDLAQAYAATVFSTYMMGWLDCTTKKQAHCKTAKKIVDLIIHES